MKKMNKLAIVMLCLMILVTAVVAYNEPPVVEEVELIQAGYHNIYRPTRLESQHFEIKLVQKDPDDWSVIQYGYKGKVKGKIITDTVCVKYKANGKCKNHKTQKVYMVMADIDAEPNTDYTLIYYGYDGNNDVWPYATCIADFTTNKYNGKGKSKWVAFDWKDMMKDGVDSTAYALMERSDINQKFWVVPSADVDCEDHMITNWNPESFLFEKKVI